MLLPNSRWRVIERSGEWPPATVFGGDDTDGTDLFVYAGSPDESYLHEVYLNSQPVPADLTFEDWRSRYDSSLRQAFPDCRRQSGYETGIVDGETARIGIHMCNIDHVAQALWSHAGRAYVLRLEEVFVSDVEIEIEAEFHIWLARINHTD